MHSDETGDDMVRAAGRPQASCETRLENGEHPTARGGDGSIEGEGAAKGMFTPAVGAH
jgi:hypothetical protein